MEEMETVRKGASAMSPRDGKFLSPLSLRNDLSIQERKKTRDSKIKPPELCPSFQFSNAQRISDCFIIGT